MGADELKRSSYMITYMIEVLKISHLQINRSIYNSLNKCYTSDIDIEIDI